MPEKVTGIIDGVFGGMPNFVLSIIMGVSGVTSHLDTIEQVGKIVSEGFLILSTVMIIIINFAKTIKAVIDGIDKIKKIFKG